jgi:predicted nuclease of predicted toxin-antitoxin system
VRFLADESCDFNAVRALREGGFDVLAVVEVSPRATDDRVIELAVLEDRILLTEDKDFGQLVYASAETSPGVVLIRFPARARQGLSAAILDLIRRRGEGLRASFTVLQPGRVRIGRPRRRAT